MIEIKKRKKKPRSEKNVKEKSNVKKTMRFDKWQRYVIVLVVVEIVAMVFFKFILIPGTAVSESMEPTIMTGDWGFSNGLAYVFKEPQRGDIIIFDSDELNEVMTKRIIGLPGETVSFYDGYVYINDGLIYEDYIGSDVETNSVISDFIVPEGCYFVLGDNRDDSYDSRFWDNPYITKDAIKGKWLTTLWHFDK